MGNRICPIAVRPVHTAVGPAGEGAVRSHQRDPELAWHPQCSQVLGHAFLPGTERWGSAWALPVPTPSNTHDALGHWESGAATGPGSGEGLPGT